MTAKDQRQDKNMDPNGKKKILNFDKWLLRMKHIMMYRLKDNRLLLMWQFFFWKYLVMWQGSWVIQSVHTIQFAPASLQQPLYINMDVHQALHCNSPATHISKSKRETTTAIETPPSLSLSHGASKQGPALGGHHGRNHGSLVTISRAWTALYVLHERTVWTHTHWFLPSFFNRQFRCFHDRSLCNHHY